MTLQEHYISIKNGKGNKAQFLKIARHLFPQYINQYLDFDTATQVLKSKQIISEAASGGVVSKGFDIWDWKKILAEEAKAEEKKVTKEVEDAQAHAYDNKDMKNADNINFNEIMKGFYAELRDEKNNGKTGDEIKAMVVKNLAKDPLYYTKNGEFGTKGVGYTDEAPGLGKPKEPKGKYKSSGYGDLDTDEKIEKVKANVQDSLGDREAKTAMPKKVKEMEVTPQNSKGVKKMPMPGKEKKIKLKENQAKETSDEKIERYEKYTYTLDGKEVKPEIAFYNNILKAELDGEIYRIGEPIDGKIELNPIKGKTGMYTESNDEKRKLKESLSPEQFAQYSDYSDQEIIQWAEEDGMEDFVVLDGEGGLANREEVLAVLLGKEIDDNIDRDEEDMWGPDDIDPAGGRGPSSHLEESKQGIEVSDVNDLLNKLNTEDNIDKGMYASVLFKIERPYLKNAEDLDKIISVYSSHIQQLNSIKSNLKESNKKVTTESKLRSVIKSIIREELK